MDADDDDVSFLSISDSDVESESVGSYAPCSSLLSEGARTDSPALSVTSDRSYRRRRTPKRQAPQPPPPVATMPPGGVEAPKAKLPSSSSFRQEFKKGSSEGPLIKEWGGGALASHPIEFLSPEQPASERISPPSTSPSSHEENRLVLKKSSSTRDFSRLQIRLIDDDSETTYGCPLTVAAYVPPQTPSEFLLRNLPPSSVFPTAPYASPAQFTPQILPPQSAPPTPTFYTSTVNMGGGVPSAPHPYSMPPLNVGSTNAPTAVSRFPLSYYQQQPPFQSPAMDMGESYPPAAQGVFMTTSDYPPSAATTVSKAAPSYRLCHSSSAPGLSGGRRLPPGRRSQGHVPRRTRRGRLDSLSEEDDSLVSDEDESLRQEEYNGGASVGRGGGVARNPVSRSNSEVTVAHLYEDLLVSSRLRLKVTLTNLTLVVVIAAFFVPNSAALIFSAFRLIFGTLFPAYYSYKAVRTKNVKEYVKWMMYWIVFAFFTCFETITDVFLSFWFPFYYEIKILVVLWLLSPATRGSSILYRKFVHPWLTRREEEIDDCIAKAKQQGYSTVVQLGTKGVNYATTVIMQTAIKGGGGLVNQLKRSYSASEIGEDTSDMNSNVKPLPLTDKIILDDDERSISSGSHDSESRNRSESESSSQRLRGHSTGRTVRSTKTRSADVSDMHFLDGTDGGTSQRRSLRTHDVMSTSVGVGGNTQTVTRRSRTGDVSNYATLPRTASKRVGAAKKKQT